MQIEYVQLRGFRNYYDSQINFNVSTLIIGANDIGKSNLLHALRILLDKSLSESELEPSELDFHIGATDISEDISITIKFSDIKEDAVISILKGAVSDNNETFLRYTAQKNSLNYKFFIGPDLDDLQEISSRFYLKYMHLKYIESKRDLERFIHREKRQLLKISKDSLPPEKSDEDSSLLNEISSDLKQLNKKVSQLNYVGNATSDVNIELKKLAHHHAEFEVQLDT